MIVNQLLSIIITCTAIGVPTEAISMLSKELAGCMSAVKLPLSSSSGGGDSDSDESLKLNLSSGMGVFMTIPPFGQ